MRHVNACIIFYASLRILWKKTNDKPKICAIWNLKITWTHYTHTLFWISLYRYSQYILWIISVHNWWIDNFLIFIKSPIMFKFNLVNFYLNRFKSKGSHEHLLEHFGWIMLHLSLNLNELIISNIQNWKNLVSYKN